jgi:hypothetical protein
VVEFLLLRGVELMSACMCQQGVKTLRNMLFADAFERIAEFGGEGLVALNDRPFQ